MIRHIFKMVWNRKGANALIAFEILIAFLVLFAVCAVGAYHYNHYRQPLGFDWENVWSIRISFGEDDIPALMDVFTGTDSEESSLTSIFQVFDRMLSELESFEEVEAAAGMSFTPYSGSGWRWTMNTDRGQVRMYLANATERLPDVMGVEIVAGRWFDESDSASHRPTVVINEQLARDAFGDEDPIGQVIADRDEEDGDTEMEVVGVITDFRYRGELANPMPFAFMWPRQEEADQAFLEAMVVRVRPGTPIAVEEALLDRLLAIAPEWSFKIEPVAAARATYLRQKLRNLVVGTLVAAFLMIMVALGLVGVLWQNVTQRTRELGLRRAKGATAARIRRQVMGELLILTSLAMAVGTLLVVQIPITGWFPAASARVYVQALALTTVLMALLTALSALYPSYLATRIQPAEALHYD